LGRKGESIMSNNYEFKIGDIVKVNKNVVPFETTIDKITITEIAEDDGNIYYNRLFLADELTKWEKK